MTKPITPEEVSKVREQCIPDYVFEAFNTYIAHNPNDVNQDKVISEIVRLSNWNYSREQILENRWLDIEDIYGQYGWNVRYVKPSYDENFDPYFVFTPKVSK